jgi:hypothetical protein
MRKEFKLHLDRIRPHNTVLLKPKHDNVKIVSISTTDDDGRPLSLLDEAIEINSNTSIRYDVITSSVLWIEIEDVYVSELSVDDFLSIEVSLAEYATHGVASFPEGRMAFHKYISLAHSIENVKDAYVQAKLGLRTLDRFGNIVYSEQVSLGLNDDREMVAFATEGPMVELPIRPNPDSIKVIVEGNYSKEFTVEDNRVYIDIPKDVSCYIIYKPFYISNGTFTQLSNNLSINSNNEIELRDDGCSTIVYTLELSVFNTGLTLINHTPIIKSLILVSSDQ